LRTIGSNLVALLCIEDDHSYVDTFSIFNQKVMIGRGNNVLLVAKERNPAAACVRVVALLRGWRFSLSV
jgi:hypothetical protein